MRAAFAALLLAVAVSSAQVKGPAEVTVAPGRLASVPLTVDADAVDFLILGDCDGFREFDPDPAHLRIRVIGYAPGVSYVVVSAAKAGKLQPLVVVKVTVAGPAPVPPPGPAPGPPDPPLPVDPLASAIKAAAAADGWPAANLSALATGFKVAASRVESRATLADIQGMAATTLKDNAAAKTPPTVRAVLAKELAALDGPDRPATDADKAGIKALFTRLATALDGASK